MSVMKKFGLGFLFVVLMYFGGLGTQSENTAFQGAGAVSVLVALVLLFALFKVIRTNMGTFSSFIVFGSITLFILYSLGWLKHEKYVAQSTDGPEKIQAENVATNENGDENSVESGGFFAKMFGSFQDAVGDGNSGFNPENYPAIEGYARALTGAMIDIEGLHVKLLGIEAPYMQQTCTDKFGQGYLCGQKARDWLQNWVQNKVIKCHIISPENNGRATGVCFSEGYDVAAVTVNAGWAVAYTKNTDIYVPYEHQAGTNKRGLWAGTFYKPWDWKKLQSRKSNIKIETNSDDSIGSAVESSFDGIMGVFK